MKNQSNLGTSSSALPPPTRGAQAGLFAQEFWGIDRHQLIAGAAQTLLNVSACDNIARITSALGSDVGLDQLAGWADQIKRRTASPDDDADTVEFLNDPRNSSHAQWHYVNLPLQATDYSRERYPAFTREDDVVQTITAGIRVLTGNSDRFSRLNALRLVVHCVGDLFQPVHVGCSYIDLKTSPPSLVYDPADVLSRQLRSDTGGNALLLPMGTKGVSLHSYWDSRLGGRVDLDDIGADARVAAFEPAEPEDACVSFNDRITEYTDINDAKRCEHIDKLVELMNVPAAIGLLAHTPLPGPLESWPAVWATDSLAAAREAYKSLSIDRPVGPEMRSFFVRWEGEDAYVARCKPIMLQRLTGAARGLADLLNGVWS
ncbi:hypothetical protein EXN22_13890 [Pseudomonas tructae]|uniref:S1/P1 nuclease n=1 Tax=Pseudomonas tructae TaxID=2518644 RepID=A0A411MIX5_9PSED|nr:S1/P1 nuclease [Pseudomonas tructae]QBF26734.1 hypothetical protein EXN22_13890 [Pseudomonas tructae]